MPGKGKSYFDLSPCEMGRAAYRAGLGLWDHPFIDNPASANEWIDGWHDEEEKRTGRSSEFDDDESEAA